MSMKDTPASPFLHWLSNLSVRLPKRTATRLKNPQTAGITAALASAAFMGMTPIFGKQAILAGLPPLAVVALRTMFAAGFLLIVMAIFYRPYLYIYPAGMLGCLLAGLVNGLGSLFYYSALSRIDASIGQLLYLLYPLFLVFWLTLDRQKPNRLTLFRLLIALPAIYLLTHTGQGKSDLIGFGLMLAASALYALHLPINQRVLYDMPAPTVTLYTLLAMSAVVTPAWLLTKTGPLPLDLNAWSPLIGLTLVTFFSRLTLFLGVKHLGGMQTALLGLSELLVTVIFAHMWLGERLSTLQWVGASILVFSLVLVGFDKSQQGKRTSGGLLHWLRPPETPQNISRHQED